MSGGGASRACFLILVMFSAAFSGCFGESGDTGINSDRDVVVTPETLSGLSLIHISEPTRHA